MQIQTVESGLTSYKDHKLLEDAVKYLFWKSSKVALTKVPDTL